MTSSAIPIWSSPGSRRGGAAVVAAVLCAAAIGAQAHAAGPLPNPCAAVSPATVEAALGVKTAPAGKLTLINTSLQSETCSYAKGKLTISVGYQAIGNPAVPATHTPVAGLSHGTYDTYAGSTQTQVGFVVGATSSGVYGTVRNTGSITKKHLIVVARELARAISA